MLNLSRMNLRKNKTLSVLDLTTKFNDKYKTKFNRSHIIRVIRDNNITLKQTRIRHEPKTRFRKPIVIKKQIKEFYSKLFLISTLYQYYRKLL